MKRYIVYAYDAENNVTSLVVPFSETSKVEELCIEARARAERQGVVFSSVQLQLRVFAVTGPILDPGDKLEDVLKEGDERLIYLTAPRPMTVPRSSASKSKPSTVSGNKNSSQALSNDECRLRMITPQLARHYNELSAIPLLEYIASPKTSLGDIRRRILTELGLPTDDSSPEVIVDMYIHDVLMETKSLEIPLLDLGLETCLVGGVLNVYTVKRPSAESGSSKSLPQCLQVLKSLSQTDRGSSIFIACLKVFQSRIKSSNMGEEAQDQVLQVIYKLTRFFPILKVVRTIMSGCKITDSQVAMLVFCFYELLKEVTVASDRRGLIGGDVRRVFEGSRLLFGYIFESAKSVQHENENNTALLMSAYKTVDFTDAITNTRVEDPVVCSLGIIERSTALNNPEVSGVGPLSGYFARIFKLSGAKYDDYSYFVYDSVLLATRARSEIPLITDLHYLSEISAANNLAVVVPADLNKAEAPCLTLDKNGYLATYIGRPSCAGPGEDYQIRISLSGDDINIDVAKVTQALEPILDARKKDGSIVFEATGTAQGRKQTDPTELIMFAVDHSHSMSSSSEFYTKELGPNVEVPDDGKIIELLGIVPIPKTQSQIIEIVGKNPSLEDILAIIRHSTSPFKTRNAKAGEIIDFLILQQRRRIEHGYVKIMEDENVITNWELRGRRSGLAHIAKEAASRAMGMTLHRSALVEFLANKALEPHANDADWAWSPGGYNPNMQKNSDIKDQSNSVSYGSIPSELVCPITGELFEDPVKAADGMIYERRAIKRWFESSDTSPATGLKIDNTRVRLHGPTLNAIEEWLAAKDIIVGSGISDPSPSKKIKLEGHSEESVSDFPSVTISFRKGRQTFSRKLPLSLSLEGLYKVAFRLLKGTDSQFSLFLDGRYLEPSDNSISSAGLQGSPTVIIGESTLAQNTDKGLSDEFQQRKTHHLFKVYDNTLPQVFKFGFWLPLSQYPTACAVLFKVWRYSLDSHIPALSHNHEACVYGNARRLGDNTWTGDQYRSWDTIIPRPKGCLLDEALYDLDPPESSTDIKVYKLALYHYSEPREEYTRRLSLSNDISRLDVAKEIFSSFINRTLAYNYANHCGLLPFSSTCEVTQEITHVLENFRDMVMKMKPDGDTKLWDALDLAIDKLDEAGLKFPKAKKRIVCLSDGKDTCSTRSSGMVMRKARLSGVVIDSFCLGKVDHSKLMSVCHNTGGYKFVPENLEDAMGVGELEPVLSLAERVIEIPAVPYEYYRPSKTPCSRDSFPKRKQHPNTNDTFTMIDAIENTTQQSDGQTPGMIALNSRGNIRTSRILSEIRNIAKNPHDYYDVYVSDANMGFWKIIMQGPSESAYSTGTFVLYLDMDEDYPLFAPKARFITPILHPNINKHGRVCHSIFDRNWTTDTSNLQVLHTIFGLLSVPEASDPINMVITLDYRWDEVGFRDEVRAHIEKHAMKSRSDLREEIES